MKQIYNVGIYCRLSVDDASNTAKARNYIPADESTSIENQDGICQGYFLHCKSSCGNSLHLAACAPTLLFMIQMFTIPMLISF